MVQEGEGRQVVDYKLTPDRQGGYVLRPRTAADAQWDGARQIAAGTHHGGAGGGGVAGLVVGLLLVSAWGNAKPTTQAWIGAPFCGLVSWIGFSFLFAPQPTPSDLVLGTGVGHTGRVVGGSVGFTFSLLAVLLVGFAVRRARTDSASLEPGAGAATSVQAGGRSTGTGSTVHSRRPEWLGDLVPLLPRPEDARAQSHHYARPATPEGWFRARANTVYGSQSAPPLVAVAREDIIRTTLPPDRDHLVGWVTEHHSLGQSAPGRLLTLHTEQGVVHLEVRRRAWLSSSTRRRLREPCGSPAGSPVGHCRHPQ